MSRLELIYAIDCPHVPEARARLRAACAQIKWKAGWKEWVTSDPSTPAHLRGYSSPSILLDGRDVSGEKPTSHPSCRLSPPSVEEIVATLRSRRGRQHSWSSLAILPAVFFALLPKIACPACWPAYAGLLGSLGLGFLLDTSYLLPLTGIFLALATFALWYRAERRRGYRPFVLGLAGAAIVLFGKFVFASDAAMYGGLIVLVAASIWNGWPKRKKPGCAACEGI
jgi:hypothetical protein